MVDGLIYHYCGVDAFFSIIRNSTLWLSDINKFNDSKERSYIQEEIYREILKLIDNQNSLDTFTGFWNATVQNETNTFVACFSEGQDLLSQWRGYGQDGQGLAIGFSFELLKSCAQEYLAKFGKVKYTNTEHTRYVKSIINSLKKDSIMHGVANFYCNERFNIPFYKNPAFKEEKEWRIVLYNNSNGLRCNNPFEVETDFKYSDITVRSDGKQLIPYVEMNFEKVKDNLIKRIYVGPKSKLRPQDVLMFLNTCNYHFDIKNILKSSATYV